MTGLAKGKNLIIGGVIALAVVVILFSAGRRFLKEGGGPESRSMPSLKNFPKSWQVHRGDGFEIYLPAGARFQVLEGRVVVRYRHGEGELLVKGRGARALRAVVSRCRPRLAMKKGDTSFYLCSRGAAYLEVVGGGTRPSVASYARARDFSTLKAISLSLASFKPLKTGIGQEGPKVTFVRWVPRDGSFSVEVPRGWNTSGGTADFGRNGYVRIVRSTAPDGSAGFLGVYYPFHQYAQTAYGSNGMAPMDPVTYIGRRFFGLLASNYQIQFPGLRFFSLKTDPVLSRRFTYEQQRVLMQHGVRASVKIQAVMGRARFNHGGDPFDMVVLGAMRYLTIPLQGAGYSYVWGPAPIYVEFAKRGSLARWMPVFERVAGSWQVSTRWLMGHQRMAMQDARRTVEHYRRMAEMIHQGYEKRSRMGMRQWESEEHERMEEFWDTYHALGGEERYDNPQTGEEIDVPTGADKYLYDGYSESWVGVKMDRPNAQDLVQSLKENGFVELKRHTH